ncbi:hypothetical protein INT43_005676 [Umbelopsis isabellina]|uniref:Fumarate reductase n=1 Tax=Mortierella isabellina TaxID=91625 RepID=A0A8H7U8U5_MORIS|nr:hypothetical protein INT43_005676 [Umbelopsis isabellina]
MSTRVIVIGGGLAGLSAALEAHAAGALVTLIEKETKLGGNSAKASSGMNGVQTASQHMLNISDTKLQFMEDTMASGGSLSDRHLVARLVEDSASAVEWIEQQGVPLRLVSQCGGHSCPRTHRIAPDEFGRAAPVGWGIMSALQRKIQGSDITVLLSSPVKRLITQNGRVTGVQLGDDQVLQTDAIVLTTGGFAGKPVHGDNSVLNEFAPKTATLATTNGPWATGDGIRLGQNIGASIRDMDKVQVHPTGFVDPKDPEATSKFLAPEALRAAGGILMNQNGLRFTNELDRRDLVTDAIFRSCEDYQTDRNKTAVANLILSQEAVNNYGPSTIQFYENKGLFRRYSHVDDLAKAMSLDPKFLDYQLKQYDHHAEKGYDQFSKTVFPSRMSDSSAYWLGKITPSRHYTMGGLRFDAYGRVLKETGPESYEPIEGR